MTFLSGELQVSERRTRLPPWCPSLSAIQRVRTGKHIGRERTRPGQRARSASHLPPLPHQTHYCATAHTDDSLFQNDLLNICCPLPAWFPVPEGKEVKKREKDTTRKHHPLSDKTQNLTKETRRRRVNWILCSGRQVSLETRNLS